MTLLDLPALEIGARVQHTLRVEERSDHTTAAGDPYVRLTLGNATGSIEIEPLWANRLAEGWADGVVRGAVVQAIGQISTYEGKGAPKRQLRLSAALRVLPRESLDLAAFLPHAADDVTKLWERLDRVRRTIAKPRLQRVLSLFFDDEPFRLRFERAPASVGGHHSVVGGLLLHVSEVAYIARDIAKVMRADVDVTVTGALLHDVGKIEAYEIGWEGFSRTPAGHLVEHVVLGAMMLDRRLDEAAARGDSICSPEQRLELQHLILSHHGELAFGSPVRPLTLEAEIVHRADEASAKAAAVAGALANEAAFPDGERFGDKKALFLVDRRPLWRRPHGWE